MTNSPTNHNLNITRERIPHLSGLPALLISTRPKVIALREVPAGKAFGIYFTDLPDVHETDRIINADATSETYRVVGGAR